MSGFDADEWDLPPKPKWMRWSTYNRAEEAFGRYEAILDVKMDRRNFRKKFFSMELLEDTHEMESDVPHRPGKLYRFNYEKYQKKERRKWFGIDF